MENKRCFAKKISAKKVGWSKLGPEEEADMVYARTDNLARISRIEREYVSTVPSVTEEGNLLYVNLGPFLSLKEAKRASDAYLHREGFVIFREDVIKAQQEVRKDVRHNNFRSTKG